MIENLLLRFVEYKQWEQWTTREGEKLLICEMDDKHLCNTIFLIKKRWNKNKLEEWQLYWEKKLAFLREQADEDCRDYGVDNWTCGPIVWATYGKEMEFAEFHLQLSKQNSIFCVPFFVIMVAEAKKRNLNLQLLRKRLY